jgi:hypothetical protein
MSRARLARYALSAYPSATRTNRGDEMLATLLDVSGSSRRRYAREVADLVRLGLRARAVETACAGVGRILADGVCLAAAWVLTLNLSVAVSQRWRGMHDPLLATPSIVLLAAVLALALIGFDRVAGVGALLWTALRFPALIADHPGTVNLATEVIPLACFVVMILAPRREPPQLRRLGYLAVPAGLIAIAGPPVEGLPVVVALAAALGVVVYAAVMLPTDPRIAIAGAIPTTCLGLGVVGHGTGPAAVLFIAVAPTVLAVTVTRTRSLRRLTLL